MVVHWNSKDKLLPSAWKEHWNAIREGFVEEEVPSSILQTDGKEVLECAPPESPR